MTATSGRTGRPASPGRPVLRLLPRSLDPHPPVKSFPHKRLLDNHPALLSFITPG